MERPVINWTAEKLREFIPLYEACKGKTFFFEGHEFDKGYAKYLIEYLEGKLGKVQS